MGARPAQARESAAYFGTRLHASLVDIIALIATKKVATKINAITTQSVIIYAVWLSSISVRVAHENYARLSGLLALEVAPA